MASHELKTPVTSLLLQLQLLQRKLKEQRENPAMEGMNRPAQQMALQIKRLTRLVDELLDVSRISSGRLEFNPEPLDLAQFLKEVVTQFEGEQDRTGSTLELRLEGALPGLWDAHRLAHIFTNLIGNAFKYGNGNPIVVTLGRDAGAAIFSVQDQGIGIPEEHHQRIFERFERAVAGQNYGGLGLGLWIVYRIVMALGGSVIVESLPGKGSRFTVRLPILSATQADIPQTQALLSP